MDTSAVDLVGSFEDLLVVTLTAEASSDKLLAVLVQQVKRGLVRTCRNLDQLRETISNLTFWEGLQECKVQEGVHRGVVSSKAVLVVAIVDSNLDTDTSIDQTDDSGGNSDEVGIPAVCGASKSKYHWLTLPRQGNQARVP